MESLEHTARDPVKQAAGRVCCPFAERKQRRLGEVRRSWAFLQEVSELHPQPPVRPFIPESQALAVLASVVNPLVEGGLDFAGSPCGSCLSCIFWCTCCVFHIGTRFLPFLSSYRGLLCLHLMIQPLPTSGFSCPGFTGLKTAGVSSLSSLKEML